ncbi:MAG TPA: protein kinase [Gemmatales bacterium]|nr:protein kinase [Gemmatales bacterium]
METAAAPSTGSSTSLPPLRPGTGAALEAAAQADGLPEAVREAAAQLRQFLADRGLSESSYLRPHDLLEATADDRQLVKAWAAAFRTLSPAQQTAQAPLLNCLARAEWWVGEFQAAQRDFQSLAQASPEPAQQGQAWWHAALAALERPNYTDALRNWQDAVAVAPDLAPLPADQFQMERILAADAHGVTLRCVLAGSDGLVVVRLLDQNTLSRPLERLFEEIMAVAKLDHPAVARSGGIGFLDEAKTRGYVVSECNDGQHIDDFVERHGHLRSRDVIAIASALAEALLEMHDQGLVHGAIRPASIVVKKHEALWRVVLSDYGVRLPRQRAAITAHNPAVLGRTRFGRSLAQHLDYLPPEVRLAVDDIDMAAGDVYSLAKCCNLLLFGNPHPATHQWSRVPEGLAELLAECLANDPAKRPSMRQVYERLESLQPAQSTAPAAAPLPKGVGVVPAPVLPSGMPERRRITADDLRSVLIRRRITFGVLILLVLGILGIIGWVFLVREPVNTVPTMVHARGKVTFEGKPVAGAKIVFHPVAPTVPRASAITAEDGTFALTTFMKDDGAYPGKYVVTIEKFDLSDRVVPNVPPNDPLRADFLQHHVTIQTEVHPNYGNPRTTPLRQTVIPPMGTSDLVLRLNVLGR